MADEKTMLSVDIGLRNFGYVVMRGQDLIHHETTDICPGTPINQCETPAAIQKMLYCLRHIIETHQPDVVLVEKQSANSPSLRVIQALLLCAALPPAEVHIVSPNLKSRCWFHGAR